jgi:zinc transport system substrate-binding protein
VHTSYALTYIYTSIVDKQRTNMLKCYLKNNFGALVLLCALSAPISASEKLEVYTVNYPLKYFAERIAGEIADVVLPVREGVDPAFWMPEADIINRYQQADIIFLNGANYAKWTGKVSLPRSKLVDTSLGYTDRLLESTEDTTHSHGMEGEHSHVGTFFTTWLDFSLAVRQAESILAALIAKMPDYSADLQSNFSALKQDLEALDQRLMAIVSNTDEHPLLASHPVYRYLARRYGLNIRSLLWEPDEVPGEQQWQELGRILVDYPAEIMIWEGQPAQATEIRLNSLGIESLVFEPCANHCATGDFLEGMKINLDRLEQLYR